jgi:hypothetical protein
MSNISYLHQESARRMSTILGLCIGIFMLVLGVYYGAPWWFYIPINAFCLMITYMIVKNKKSGMRLEEDILYLYSGKWQETLNCKNIDFITVKHWSDSKPDITLHLLNQQSFIVPTMCFGSWKEFTDALQRRGIKVAS